MEKYLNNFNIAIAAIINNRVRAMLTALGILFGVSAVITMLAIGKGAKEEIIEQLKFIGSNNIIVTSIIPKIEEDENGESKKPKFSKGLSIKDLEAINKIVSIIGKSAVETELEAKVIQDGRTSSVKLIGISEQSFDLSNLAVENGSYFVDYQSENALPVCIIGKSIEKKLFLNKEALGEYIKVNDQWLKVIGILEERTVSSKAQDNLGIRNFNMDIYIPINTLLVRFVNRSITKPAERRGNDKNDKVESYHQVDKMTLQVKDELLLSETANVVARMLKRRHNDVLDFEVTIPVHLLEQQQKTKDIFNIVLSTIAGISLLVGGIEIMNIMLASVMERTREIGIRLSIGATKEDIVIQFMFEAVLISLGGGFMGVVLGIVGSYFVESVADIKTIISGYSILLSFGVSVTIGLVFGISPAKKAAKLNPIESLRYE